MSYGIDPQPQGSQPGESVNMFGAISNFFTKYAQFSGRSSRSEFWWMQLVFILLAIFFGVVLILLANFSVDPNTGEISNGGALFALALFIPYSLICVASIIPNIALTVRRLHDVNLSGWFYFLCCVPLGWFALLVLCARESNPQGAAFDA